MTEAWRHRFLITAPFVAIGLLAMVTPSDDGPTICPFALCTGSACPGCGLTRAASSLIRGDFGAAMMYHPLVLLIAAQVVGGWGWYMLRRAGKVGPMSQTTLTVILASTAAVMIAVWVLRMISGTLPPV